MDERMKGRRDGSNFGKELFVERRRASDRCFYSSSSSSFFFALLLLSLPQDIFLDFPGAAD
jgi:hypothetical protein